MQYPNPHEPDFGESPKPTRTDYLFGALWTVYGIAVLIFAHVRDRFRIGHI
jgi:hypothetical protein